MVRTQPNLFEYGTTELTQDAVLCWLLNWADSRLAAANPTLHAAGKALLGALLATHGFPLPSETTVTTRRQHHRIDVVARIGKEYLIGIEDKTESRPHSNQLTKYKGKLNSMAKTENIQHVVAVYVKTGERNEDDYVRSKGWQVFGRSGLLSVLDSAVKQGANNDILLEYRSWLRRQEDDAMSWQRVPAQSRWSWRAWQGFYSALEDRMSWATGMGWGYVANAAGGFQAMWWGWYSAGEVDVYLQLQQGTLAVRLLGAANAKVPINRVRHWSVKVIHQAREDKWPLTRPKRLRSGHTTAIALWADWRVVGDGGVVDLEATVARLRELSQWAAGVATAEISTV